MNLPGSRSAWRRYCGSYLRRVRDIQRSILTWLIDSCWSYTPSGSWWVSQFWEQCKPDHKVVSPARGTDRRKPVRLFASTMHKAGAIIASATTPLPNDKYNKYWVDSGPVNSGADSRNCQKALCLPIIWKYRNIPCSWFCDGTISSSAKMVEALRKRQTLSLWKLTKEIELSMTWSSRTKRLLTHTGACHRECCCQQ